MSSSSSSSNSSPTYLTAEQEEEEGVSKYMKAMVSAPPRIRVAELTERFNIPDVAMYAKVKHVMQENQEYAYTIARLMIDHFNIRQIEVEGEARVDKRTPGATTVYEKIRKSLKTLQKEKKIKSIRTGKYVHFYWAGEEGSNNNSQMSTTGGGGSSNGNGAGSS